MPTSAPSDYLRCSRTTSLTSRTAVYGPVRTVVWQGSAADCRPYADQAGFRGPNPARRTKCKCLCEVGGALETTYSRNVL
jgi:hypothetical protein